MKQKQRTKNQHYLPRYRISFFLNKSNNLYIYDVTKNRSRKSGKNDTKFAVDKNLYEWKKCHRWKKFRGQIETYLFAQNVEKNDARQLRKIIYYIKYESFKHNNKLRKEDANWLGYYTIRMIFRTPLAVKLIKGISKKNPYKFIAMMETLNSDKQNIIDSEKLNKIRIQSDICNDGTIILHSALESFILPDKGFVICNPTEYKSKIIITPLTPSLCAVTALGKFEELKHRDGEIIAATLDDVEVINQALFFAAQNEVCSKYSFNPHYIDKIKHQREEFNERVKSENLYTITHEKKIYVKREKTIKEQNATTSKEIIISTTTPNEQAFNYQQYKNTSTK